MFRPERAFALATALAAGIFGAGCGKSDLVRQGGHASTEAHSSLTPGALRAGPPAVVAIPLRLTAARAGKFARGVNLVPVDVPGSHRTPRSPNLESQKEEAAECGASEAQAIGGGRSAKLDRGAELNSESISSSVIVLRSTRAARADLAFAESAAGLACYGKILRKKLAGESTSRLSVGHVVVSHLTVAPSQGPTARGIRITSRISGVKSGITISLFVDAVAFDYGPGRDRALRHQFRPTGGGEDRGGSARGDAAAGPSRGPLEPLLRPVPRKLRGSGGCAGRRVRPCPWERSAGRLPACPSGPSHRTARRSRRSVRQAPRPARAAL